MTKEEFYKMANEAPTDYLIEWGNFMMEPGKANDENISLNGNVGVLVDYPDDQDTGIEAQYVAILKKEEDGTLLCCRVTWDMDEGFVQSMRNDLEFAQLYDLFHIEPVSDGFYKAK